MTNEQIASGVIDALMQESGLSRTEQAQIRKSLFDGDGPERWDFASLTALAVYLGLRAMRVEAPAAAKAFAAIGPMQGALNNPARRGSIPSTWTFNPMTGELAVAGAEFTAAARYGVVVLPLQLYIQRLERQVVRLQSGADKAHLN